GVCGAGTSVSDITQPEDRAGYRRGTRKSPGSATIAGNCSARVIGITGIQIAAAYDSVVRIAEIDRERTCARRAHQRSVVSIPSIALIRGCKNPGDVSATCGNPRIPPALHCDAGS